MKKIGSNEVADLFETKASKKDIVKIDLIENATIKFKKTNEEYMNGAFLRITDRKGNIRVLDLKASIDITNMLKDLEIVYNKKTTETDMFTGV